MATAHVVQSGRPADGLASACGSFTLVLGALLFATGPVVASAAEAPDPASEERPDGDREDAPSEQERGEGFWHRFRDPEDGKLDLTAGGSQGAGFLPLAIPFNDPAVGFGLALALTYFHPASGDADASSESTAAPPTASFGAVAGTTNGSWFVAAGHHHVWRHDRIRYLGAVGGGPIDLTFFGFGDEDTNKGDGLDFTIEVVGTVQQVKFRIGRSPVLLGAKYVYATTDTSFDTELAGPLSGETEIAGLAGLVEYDSRDTVFTPGKGLRASVELSWFSEALGGDFDFASAKAGLRYYWPLARRWTLGFRADLDAVGDDAPFYALPFVKLRGVPVFRYLGNYAGTIEVEPRYRINARWSVLAFAGAGRAATEIENLSDADKVYGYGAGFRYLLARKLGLGAGIDVAEGPEDTVAYLTIGSAW